ncbi:MAG TPA: hypothetical protein VJ932_10590 [Alkalispirochaeta sp.]|nr:hypothetical protein [Alkalispirochaeta sp.]
MLRVRPKSLYLQSMIVAAILMMVVSGIPIHGQWQWPTPAEAGASFYIRDGSISPWWSVSADSSDRDDARSLYRFVAPGTVVYYEVNDRETRGTDTVPRVGDRVVLRHGDGLWSLYEGANLRLSGASWEVNTHVERASRFSADGPVSFAIFDAVRRVFVNARAILPEGEVIPEDGLPVVGFIQNGSLTLSRNLTGGDAQFVVPQQWFEPATLPRRLSVRVDGSLQAEIDFTIPQEAAHRMTPDGHLLLLPMILEPGPVVVEVESHQFDGSIERRTIPFRVPDTGVLDRP